MSHNHNIINETSLQFFGLISASISHEIKNTLAIINENVGLLNDFVLMSDKGTPLNPERIKKIADKITKQIHRTDEIVKNMNGFAHSVEKIYDSVVLDEVLNRVISSSNRLVMMGNVNLKIKHSENPINLKTFPFFLQNFIWLCLNFIINLANEARTIDIITEKNKSTAIIKFTLPGLSNNSITTFPAEREKALLDILHAELKINFDDRELVIMLPEDIN